LAERSFKLAQIILSRRLISINLDNKSFVNSVSTLALGTFISQIILFITSIVLTSLFEVSDFGIFALFSSIAAIAGIITTARYDLAIVLPIEEDNASKIVVLVIYLGAIISFIFMIIILLLNQFNLYDYANNELKLYIACAIPFYTLFSSVHSSFLYWNQRDKRYKLISFSTIIQALVVSVANILFGLVGLKVGMVYGLLLGQLAAIYVLRDKNIIISMIRNVKLTDIITTARKYKSFPQYMIISDLSITINQQIIPLMFSLIFNSTIVGYFSLANRVLRIPGMLLSSSIGNVFRNDAIDIIRKTGNCKALYYDTIKKLVIIAFPIFGALALISPWIFAHVFGQKWMNAGYYAQCICIMLVFNFIASPLNTLFYIVKKQRIYMVLQFVSMIIGTSLIIVVNYLFHDPYYTIISYVIGDAIISIVSIRMTYRISCCCQK
jgi:teichuronic acid exporter